MEFLKVINDYAQLINFVLFAAIVGWLVRITTISRRALTDKHDAALAAKDVKIAQLEKSYELAKLESDNLEKDRERLRIESADKEIDPHRLRETFEFLKMKSDSEVEDLKKELKEIISEAELKDKELEQFRDLNKRLEEQLSEQMSIMSVFAASLTHDLRASIASISHRADYLSHKRTELPEQKIDLYLDGIIRETGRLNQTTSLIPLIVSEDPIFETSVSRVSISSSINKVLRRFKDEFFQKNIFFKLTDLENLPYIKINEASFETAISNLIDNTINYSNEKGIINIVGAKRNDRIELKFQDFGIGVSENQLEHIFKAGYRGPESVRMTVSGSGFGLFITKKIIESNGGKIVVSNRSNPTEFKITFPIN
jgi:signal transduction histidine kinase